MRGRGYCYLDSQRVELHTGSLVLLDCYLPHRYGTDSGWEIYWIHFDGRMTRDYFEAIVQSRRQIILPRNAYHAVHALERIYNMFHVDTRINEARFYLRTTQLSLKEISYRYGYGSDLTFCTTFNRITGMTPLEYRNQR